MKISVLRERLREAPQDASLLVQGPDGAWRAVTEIDFTYGPPLWSAGPPANVCAHGEPVEVGKK
jgi:hypothetical protein